MKTLSPSPLPELLARIHQIDRDLAALQWVYDLLSEPRKETRRPPTPRKRGPLVMPDLVDVREFHGVAPLWAFMEDVESDTTLPKSKKQKAGEAVDVSQARLPVKALPMHPTPLPAPAARVSSLARTRREGLGYDGVYAGKRVKQPNGKGATVKGDPVINHALAEVEAVDGELVALA
jgi:hypothetical protein